MYPVTTSFLEAIENEAIQHIRGRLTDITDAVTDITDSLADNITIESQCVEDADCFNFGGMYIGTLDCVLNLGSRKKDELIDGKITLDFGVDTALGTEWIPLGVWNITECTIESSGRLKIKGMDNFKLLLTETGEEKQSFIGVVQVSSLMKHVTDLTGVEFAQTIEELRELTTWRLGTDIFGVRYGRNAWAEVKSIAQILGCFAFANREGKIEFRRLDNTDPVLTVPAEKRHDMRLEEYTYTVQGINYTNGNGHRVVQRYIYAKGIGAIFDFSGNLLIRDSENADLYYLDILDRISANIKNIAYTPGEVTYYGNPALDVGDYIKLTGGMLGDDEAQLLICCNTWQFRAPQTLKASGFSEAGTGGAYASSGSAGSSASSIRNITVTKSVEYVELSDISGELYDELRTVASCGFSCRAGTVCFLECNMMIQAEESCTAQARIYVDSVLQTLQPVFSLREGEYTTVHFSLNLSPSEGAHSISISASGSGTVSTAAYVWGQNITAEQPDSTDSSDYLYTVDSGSVTIDEYIGSSLHPLLPSRLSGAPVTVIGREAFIESEIISAAIPEGITEIQ